MRRLTAGEVIAVATGASFAGLRSFAFVAPAYNPAPTRRPARIEHAEHVLDVALRRQQSFARRPTHQRRARQGGGDEDEAYREDDQRRFWDTVVEVLTQELGTGDQLSRVWEFVRHNKDGEDAPAETPSYRATGLYFPGLEAKPWWDRSEFSWLQDLEGAAPDITLEMEALARAGGGAPYKGGSGEMSTVYDATQGWGTMRLRYMGRFGQPGINYSLLPRTLSTLRRLPLAPETAAFQRQLPGTGLPIHVDPSNFILGCHLGVVIPPPAGPVASNTARAVGGSGPSGDRRRSKKRSGRTSGMRSEAGASAGGGGFGFGGGSSATRGAAAARGREGDRSGRVGEAFLGEGDCAAATAVGVEETKSGDSPPRRGGDGAGMVGERAWIEVSGEKRHWQTGRAFVFDPSFLHRTHNPTAGERVILNIDVWHPGLEEVEKTAIGRVCEMVEQWNTRTGLFQ